MKRSLCAALAILFASLLTLQTTIAQNQDHRQFIPSSAMLAILSSPMDAINQPSMELFPYEVATTMGQKELGFDPCKITKLTMIVDSASDFDTPPGFGVVVEFAQAQKIEDMNPQVIGDMVRVDFEGKPYFQSEFDGDGMPGLLQFNDNTIIAGMKPFLRKMLNTKGAQSKLITLVESHSADRQFGFYMAMEPMRAMIKDNLPPAEQVPPMFRNFLELPDLIDSVVATASFAESGQSNVSFNAASETDAARMQEIINEGMELGQQMAMMQLREAMQDEDPELQDSVQRYVTRISKYVRGNFMPGMSADGKSLVFENKSLGGGTSLATVGVLTGLLLPAVQQVREAARRTDSANRLRQLALASLNYESAFRKYPAQAIYSEDGKPLLSWRVQILPFIEENELYERFHLDEPWDSEHNIKLLDEMPDCFLSPNSVHRNKTIFLALQGEGTVMDGTNQATKIGNITDGTSYTILFVEADDNMAVEWTKPSDLRFNPENPLKGLGTLRPGGFNAVFCDGSVHFLSNDLDEETMRRLTFRNDGKIIDGF